MARGLNAVNGQEATKPVLAPVVVIYVVLNSPTVYTPSTAGAAAQ